MSEPEQNDGAQREQLIARKLIDLQQNFVESWRALLEAVEFLNNAATEQPSESSQPARIPTYVWGRDSQGQTIATAADGTVLHRSSESNIFVGPFTFYLCDDLGIIRKQRVDECGTWEITR